MGSQPLAAGPGTRRGSLPFRAVNRRGEPTHDAALQRHHLLPRQLLRMDAFAKLFECISTRAIGFEDFRRNGLLLPAREEAVLRLGLPLHRGPHRDYNAVVIERVGQIEMAWSLATRRDSARAGIEALQRLAALQQDLRAELLAPRVDYLRLHANDPLGKGFDFSVLDDMAERLWSAT